MSETITIEAGGTLHRISNEVAELAAFNLRAFEDEYLTNDERLALADKFEKALVEGTDEPLRFTDVEDLCLTRHVDHLCVGPHRSPDLIALFWALRGTDPPKEPTQ